MKTMTRPAAARPAADENFPHAPGALAGHRSGRPSQVSGTRWGLLALAGAGGVLVAAPQVAPWLLLPIVPAVLLRSATCDGPAPQTSRVMRVFSVATLAAVGVQGLAAGVSTGTAAVMVALTILFLASLERAVADPQRLSWEARRGVVD